MLAGEESARLWTQVERALRDAVRLGLVLQFQAEFYAQTFVAFPGPANRLQRALTESIDEQPALPEEGPVLTQPLYVREEQSVLGYRYFLPESYA